MIKRKNTIGRIRVIKEKHKRNEKSTEDERKEEWKNHNLVAMIPLSCSFITN
jgi:hypothetical protein